MDSWKRDDVSSLQTVKSLILQVLWHIQLRYLVYKSATMVPALLRGKPCPDLYTRRKVDKQNKG